MMALPAYDPPAIVVPGPEQLFEVRRKRRRNHDNDQTAQESFPQSNIPSWIYVGAFILLTDSDGKQYPCNVVHVDYENELYYCAEDQ
jgi:hypothetical protein